MKCLKIPRSSRYIACGLIMNNEITEAFSLINKHHNGIQNTLHQLFPRRSNKYYTLWLRDF